MVDREVFEMDDRLRVLQVGFDRRHDDPRLDRQQIDAGQRHLDPGVDDNALVEHMVENVDDTCAL